MSKIENSVVLITGAASGIGKELVLILDEMAAKKLILLDINEAGLDELGKRTKTEHQLVCIDLSQDVSLNENFKNVVSENVVDIVIANAGLGGINPGDQFNEQINRKMMSVNFFGTTGVVSAVLEKMINQKSGHIVGVASLAGLRGMPQAASYSASKAAQITYLESLRLDLKPYSIKVTTVLPGFIATKMTNHDEFKMPFMLSAKDTANRIISAIVKNKRHAYFPFPMNALSLFNRFLPGWFYDWIILLINPPQKKKAKIF